MMTKISSKSIFFWNMAGNISAAALSVLFLLVVSRLLGTQAADTFSIAYAVGHLLVIIGLFQVRNYQATDVEERYPFNTYLGFRWLTCLVMLLALLVYLSWQGYTGEKGVTVVLVVLLRLTDALSDVYQGFFQQKERLDLAGKSLFYRNALVFMSFTLVAGLTKQLVLALLCAVLLSSAFIWLFDRQHARRLNSSTLKEKWAIHHFISLGCDAFPLFLTGFLLAYIYNHPKYAIEALMMRSGGYVGLQKEFNILFLPVFVLNLMMLFLRPQVTQLAVLNQKGDQASANRLQQQMVVILTAISGLVLVASYLLGLPILSVVFATDLSAYQQPFMLLMLSGIFSSFATLFDNILTVRRQQYYLVLPYALSFLTSLVLTKLFVFKLDILGAAYSFLVSMVVWLVAMMCLHYGLTKRQR